MRSALDGGGRPDRAQLQPELAVETPDTEPSPAPGIIDRAALGTLHAAFFVWTSTPDFSPIGWLLLVGAMLNRWRLLRWRGAATLPEPLLFVLHVGYAWMVLGAALLGLSMLDADVPLTAAVHALAKDDLPGERSLIKTDEPRAET